MQNACEEIITKWNEYFEDNNRELEMENTKKSQEVISQGTNGKITIYEIGKLLQARVK